MSVTRRGFELPIICTQGRRSTNSTNEPYIKQLQIVKQWWYVVVVVSSNLLRVNYFFFPNFICNGKEIVQSLTQTYENWKKKNNWPAGDSNSRSSVRKADTLPIRLNTHTSNNNKLHVWIFLTFCIKISHNACRGNE